MLHFCRPGFRTLHIPPWSSKDLQVLRICRSQRLDMGLKRVSGVRRYQGQCRALRPLGHQGYRLRSYKKDQPLCSGYTRCVLNFSLRYVFRRHYTARRPRINKTFNRGCFGYFDWQQVALPQRAASLLVLRREWLCVHRQRKSTGFGHVGKVLLKLEEPPSLSIAWSLFSFSGFRQGNRVG